MDPPLVAKSVQLTRYVFSQARGSFQANSASAPFNPALVTHHPRLGDVDLQQVIYEDTLQKAQQRQQRTLGGGGRGGSTVAVGK